MKNKTNKNFVRLVAISIMIIFLATSVNSAVVKNNITSGNGGSPPPGALSTNYYEWKDEFDNAQLIDSSKSYNYEVSGGDVHIKDTYPVWTDPAWTRMKPITVTNSGDGVTDYAIKFVVAHDSDMQSDYGDIRFKHEDTPTNFLSYWIQSYDTSSVTVWVKIPSLKHGTNNMYLFYGNPDASSESDFGSVFTDWQEQWANDEQVSYKAGNQEGCWDSDVSYGNGEFLVAWEQGMYWDPPWAGGFKQEIHASIYQPDGTQLVNNKIIFEDSGVDWWRNENPNIAYNGNGKWFVAWEHYNPVANPSIQSEDIYARTVQRSGSDISVGALQQVCTATDCQADANVQYDSVNDRFMVAWEDARAGESNYDIWARLYNSDGTPYANEKHICSDANSQCEVWAAFDPIHQQYFFVWEEGVTPANGPFRLRGGIFDKDLNTITTFTVAQPSGWPNNNVDYNFPCVRFNQETQRFLVTWNEDDISNNDWFGSIDGKIYDTSGNVVVDQFTIKAGAFERTRIVPYLSDGFIVAFDGGQKIWAELISSDGDSLSSDILLSTSQSALANRVGLATDGSKLFSAWDDKRLNYPYPWDDNPDIFANMKYLNIPSQQDISYTFGDEKQIILNAQVTSVKIEPSNLKKWHAFLDQSDPYDGTIVFDILDGTSLSVIMHDVTNGQDLSTISISSHPSLRLRAIFTRTDPTYTPKLYSWTVQYEGIDTEPPVTSVDKIDGTQGVKPWYISECVTIWLKAVDYPEDTGSGVNITYYTIDGGTKQIYNKDSGIFICSHEPDWYVNSVVNFWSVDNEGNVEDHTKPDNYRTILIDHERPWVQITSPAEEGDVAVPFMVYADATDNVAVTRVDFDMEPFGQRPGLPFSDYTAPYEWYCDQKPPHSRILATDPYPASASLQIRAEAYDASGQYWINEIFIHITNWNKSSTGRSVIYNFRPLREGLNIGIVTDKSLKVSMYDIDGVDSVKFVATKAFTGKQTTIWDNDVSNGISANFNIPTGFYKISATTYNGGNEIASNMISWVLFVKK